MLEEVEVRERLKQFDRITVIVDTGLFTSIVITRGTSIAAFAVVFDYPLALLLVEIVYFFTFQQSSHKNLLKPLP